MPRKAAGEHWIHVSVSKAERKLLKAAAGASDMAMVEFVRREALKGAKRRMQEMLRTTPDLIRNTHCGPCGRELTIETEVESGQCIGCATKPRERGVNGEPRQGEVNA